MNKLEWKLGRKRAEGPDGDGPILVDLMCQRGIPMDDYRKLMGILVRDPDPQSYWEGYNSFFLDTVVL